MEPCDQLMVQGMQADGGGDLGAALPHGLWAQTRIQF